MNRVSRLERLETGRQLFHASGAIVPLIACVIGVTATLLLLSFLFAVILSLSVTYRRGVHIPFFHLFIDRFERADVREKFPGKGAVYYVIGMILPLLFFEESIAFTCILITCLGDAGSTLVGKNFGTHRIPYNTRKTIEGSLACLVLSISAAATQVPPELAVIAGTTGTLVESLPLRVDDNLTIPLIVGITLTALTGLGLV